MPRPAAPTPAAALAPEVPSGFSPAKEAIICAKIIEELRPIFRRDGGDVEMVDMEGSLVLVHLTGACSGCQLASQTLGGIQMKLSEALGRPVRVMPVAKT
ncbi:NifU family protein [Alloyangia pacifica]|uniref:NifU family protein n=1 Tax=Alloyangia pacifica TaxID=311180 RepID=UPI001CD599BC|nr:NifU family protein [Alloyangia pacifica]MCA0994646.1 NifU family protein [Alloyangia pacifica]